MSDKVKITIWDREFELWVVYQNFPDEDVIDNQKKTISYALSMNFNDAQNAVKEYIKKHNGEDIKEDGIANIFKYVMPNSLLVPRSYDKRIFAIMCDYKFDMEHGLAIVFENEKYKSVGAQDIIL